MTSRQWSKAIQALPDDVWETLEAEASGETARREAQRRQNDPEEQKRIENIREGIRMWRKFNRIIGIGGIAIFTIWAVFSGILWLIYVLRGGQEWSLYMFFAGPILGFAGMILSSCCLIRFKKI